jgi:hypothetical protein
MVSYEGICYSFPGYPRKVCTGNYIVHREKAEKRHTLLLSFLPFARAGSEGYLPFCRKGQTGEDCETIFDFGNDLVVTHIRGRQSLFMQIVRVFPLFPSGPEIQFYVYPIFVKNVALTSGLLLSGCC